jgi:hypothetical protein
MVKENFELVLQIHWPPKEKEYLQLEVELPMLVAHL